MWSFLMLLKGDEAEKISRGHDWQFGSCRQSLGSLEGIGAAMVRERKRRESGDVGFIFAGGL